MWVDGGGGGCFCLFNNRNSGKTYQKDTLGREQCSSEQPPKCCGNLMYSICFLAWQEKLSRKLSVILQTPDFRSVCKVFLLMFFLVYLPNLHPQNFFDIKKKYTYMHKLTREFHTWWSSLPTCTFNLPVSMFAGHQSKHEL